MIQRHHVPLKLGRHDFECKLESTCHGCANALQLSLGIDGKITSQHVVDASHDDTVQEDFFTKF